MADVAMSEISLSERVKIRWRARHIADPAEWDAFVRFEELVASNSWDLARHPDELNERYADVPRD